MGEAIVAVVQVNDDNQKSLREMIMRECNKQFPSYKIPKFLHFIREFPLNASNKIDRQAILDYIKSMEKNT